MHCCLLACVVCATIKQLIDSVLHVPLHGIHNVINIVHIIIGLHEVLTWTSLPPKDHFHSYFAWTSLAPAAKHYWSFLLRQCLQPGSPSCKTCTNPRQSPGWKPAPVMSRLSAAFYQISPVCLLLAGCTPPLSLSWCRAANNSECN